MADFVDFIADARYDKNEEGVIAFIDLLGKNPGEDELLTFFKNRNYEGVSLEDCKKILTNRDSILKYGSDLQVKNSY